MKLRFGDFVFDPEARQLWRKGSPVPLAPKVFQLLEALITERPKAVSRAALHQHLWPDTHVSEANLANLVADLREALGDDAKRPHLVRTVQRFGYAFQAEARPESPETPSRDSVYRIVWGDREVTLREGPNVLGRDPDAVLWIDVYSVSRQHARITVAGDEAVLEDLESKNGTFVRGRRVRGPAPLKDGDQIRIGTVTMTLRRFDPVSTRTAGRR
jgi:DNA-binding winged helix-turn-helix (wHTH) protein